jgi:hypothetical protein
VSASVNVVTISSNAFKKRFSSSCKKIYNIGYDLPKQHYLCILLGGRVTLILSSESHEEEVDFGDSDMVSLNKLTSSSSS